MLEVNARLTNDVDMSSIENFPSIGNKKYQYKGTFDGQHHTVSNLHMEYELDYTGFLGAVAGGAALKNITFDSSCTIIGKNYTGAVGGFYDGMSGDITISNVGFEGEVAGTKKYAAGIIGGNKGADATFYITNCYSTGTISGASNNAAIAAWTGDNRGTLASCWSSAEVINAEDDAHYLYQGKINSERLFCTKGTQGTIVTDAQIKSGELAYMLNNSSVLNVGWYQDIGEDEHPVTDSSHGLVFPSLEGFIGINSYDFTTMRDYLLTQMNTEADEAIFDEWESIPMGYFDVKKCSRQASTGIIKVTAYNKLQSDYLDVKANESVLTQFVDENPEILIYDLKRALLSEYQIEEAEVVNVMRNPIGTGMDLDDGSATKFTNLYGDTGPINPTNIGVNLNTEFNIAVLTYTNEWDLDPTKYYRIDSRYNLDVFEQSFFDYYRGLIVNSFINIDTDVYMQNLVTLCKGDIYTNPTLRTWKNIFAIVLTKEDDSTECYTLVGQQYGLNNIYGGMHDLTKRTITGYKKIEVWVPIRLERYVKISSSQWTIDRILNFGGKPIRYEYLSEYTEERMVNYWPAFKYPDGAEISNGIRPHMFMSINEIDSLSDADKITVNLNDLPDFTMRDIVTASYETQCQFGQLSRITDLFAGVELGHSRLLPAETLYPTTNLYPGGARLSGSKAMYSKLWADEGNIHKWRNLIITYKGLDEEENEKEFTLQKQVNADGTDDYNCSDNWLFKNLVWTESQIEDYADAMVAKMAGITWFPFEMWCAGLPYLETGDEIEIPLGDQKYVSYVLQRQLKGIQNLQDTYINGTLDIY